MNIKQELIAIIMATRPNPAEWLIELRAICESGGLAPERAILLGSVTLEVACAHVAREVGNGACDRTRFVMAMAASRS